MSLKDTLIQKIEARSATVAVLGLGYVGLPLALEFAEAGFRVLGVDVDAHKVDMLNQGTSYIEDIPDDRLQAVVDSGAFSATNRYDDIREADTISICVPTPLSATRDPEMRYILAAMGSVQQIAHPGMLISLESTTYPGTTEEIILPHLQEAGLVAGETVFVAFSGERIDPGNKRYHLRNTPKVVGGVTTACTEVARCLYETAVDTVVPVSSPSTAEMVKLLENTFRAVNIGLANEMALVCDRLGLNVWEVIQAATTKPFGFMPFYPGPGVGGHCIPLDPHYLGWKMRTLGYTTRFIELASEVNSAMPEHVVHKISDALNDQSKAIRGSRVLVLGAAYKPNVNDVRESPALEVIEQLQARGGLVQYHDPFVPSIRMNGHESLHSAEYSAELLSGADCVVIITDHDSYDWAHVVRHSRIIVDTRNALREYDDSRIVRL